MHTILGNCSKSSVGLLSFVLPLRVLKLLSRIRQVPAGGFVAYCEASALPPLSCAQPNTGTPVQERVEGMWVAAGFMRFA